MGNPLFLVTRSPNGRGLAPKSYKACSPVFHTFEKAVQTHPLAPCSRLLAGGTRAAGTRKKNEQKRRRWRRARACQSGTSRAGRGAIQALFTGVWPLQVVGLTGGRAPCALPAPSRGPTRHLGCLWHGRGPPRGWAWPAARRVACAASVSDVQAAPASGSAAHPSHTPPRPGRAAPVSSHGVSCMCAAAVATAGPPDGPQSLPSACCRGESARQLQRSRVQWRARGYLGHQVVALAHSEQGCALVGLCLSM